MTPEGNFFQFPKIGTKCCSGDGEGREDKGGGGGPRSTTKLCVKVVCERERVTKMVCEKWCVKHGV